jgi:hypothetical protein
MVLRCPANYLAYKEHIVGVVRSYLAVVSDRGCILMVQPFGTNTNEVVHVYANNTTHGFVT